MRKSVLSMAACLGLCCLLLSPAAMADDGTALADSPPAAESESAEQSGGQTQPEQSGAQTQEPPAAQSGGDAGTEQAESGGKDGAAPVQNREAEAPQDREDAPAPFLLGPGDVIELDDTPPAGESAETSGAAAKKAGKTEKDAARDQTAPRETRQSGMRAVWIAVPLAFCAGAGTTLLVRRKKQ